MAIESQTMKLGTAAAAFVVIVSAAWGMLSWAQGEHEKSEKLAREAATLAKEAQRNNELLVQIQQQQADLVKDAAKDARTNRETLIRIEAKLEDR